jgi:ABC-type polysaccharide/polyol phosphate export permease
LLGWGWNVIQPGSQALLLFLATRAALRVPDSTSALAGFGIFFAAFITAQGMGEIISRGPTLVAERTGWVKGSLFPLELLAPTAVGVALYRIIPGGLLGIAIVGLTGGIELGLATLAGFALGLIVAVVWGAALALALAAIGVYLRDAILAAPILTLAVIFLSPLYISPDAGPLLQAAVGLNPLAIPMNLVLHGPGWISANAPYFLAGIGAALLALWIAARSFRRLSANFADYI